MLTTYDRILAAYRRKVRLEAALSYRESDRREVGEEYTWTRYRPTIRREESHDPQK